MWPGSLRSETHTPALALTEAELLATPAATPWADGAAGSAGDDGGHADTHVGWLWPWPDCTAGLAGNDGGHADADASWLPPWPSCAAGSAGHDAVPADVHGDWLRPWPGCAAGFAGHDSAHADADAGWLPLWPTCTVDHEGGHADAEACRLGGGLSTAAGSAGPVGVHGSAQGCVHASAPLLSRLFWSRPMSKVSAMSSKLGWLLYMIVPSLNTLSMRPDGMDFPFTLLLNHASFPTSRQLN